MKFLPASCPSPERPRSMSSRGKTNLSLWQKITPRASPETAAPGCLEPVAVLQRTTFPPVFSFWSETALRDSQPFLGEGGGVSAQNGPLPMWKWLMDLERHEIRFRKAVLSRLCGFQTQGCCHAGKASPRSLCCSSLGVGLGGLIVSVTVLTRVSPSMERNQHHRRTQFQGGFLTCGFWLLSHADLKG